MHDSAAENVIKIGAPEVSIQRILVATDGSSAAITATEFAIALAKTIGAKMKAVFVESDDERADLDVPLYNRDVLKEISPSPAGLNVARLYAEKNQIDFESQVISGSVARAIIEAADDFGADIIFMGNTGRTGIRRLALGSVAEAVVQNSHIPVMVLKG